MAYTQLKIKSDYRDKLQRLATAQNRSMANMIEVLIDQADTQVITAAKNSPDTTTKAEKNANNPSQTEGEEKRYGKGNHEL